jgi:uncharacterized protein YecE (DUF72 family)
MRCVVRIGKTFVGTSGWVYKSWRQHLYEGVPLKKWLHHASRVFDTLEINGSFYSQIKPETYAKWREATPDGFRFSVKGHRFVTHYKRLLDCERSIQLLKDQAILLEHKLACVIWQLPAHLEGNPARLESFLGTLALWPEARHAIELRHKSWFTDDVARLLEQARVANCMGDAPDFPMWRAVTTDLVYVRLHGHTRKYASSYSPAHLRRWADDAERWNAEGRDVYIYFDNDAEGAAVHNAITLRAELDARASRRDAPPSRTRRAAAR